MTGLRVRRKHSCDKKKATLETVTNSPGLTHWNTNQKVSPKVRGTVSEKNKRGKGRAKGENGSVKGT